MPHKYRVNAAQGLQLPAGMPVKLTDPQLTLRRHQVAEVNGYHVAERDRLSFKRGEVVELATELPKAMIAQETVIPLDENGAPVQQPLVPSKPTPGPVAARKPPRR